MEIDALSVGPVIPVSDMAASRSFYEGKLGLQGMPAPGGYALRTGAGSRIFLLDGTDYAGRADWPLASLQTDDLAATVADLGERGSRWRSWGTAIRTGPTNAASPTSGTS
ncbi:MAG TPA: hypothetical protein VLB81_01150 [Gaiellales bacterium]|nr:hypothetical protein [Gaiellales bacterium]